MITAQFLIKKILFTRLRSFYIIKKCDIRFPEVFAVFTALENAAPLVCAALLVYPKLGTFRRARAHKQRAKLRSKVKPKHCSPVALPMSVNTALGADVTTAV